MSGRMRALGPLRRGLPFEGRGKNPEPQLYAALGATPADITGDEPRRRYRYSALSLQLAQLVDETL